MKGGLKVVCIITDSSNRHIDSELLLMFCKLKSTHLEYAKYESIGAGGIMNWEIQFESLKKIAMAGATKDSSNKRVINLQTQFT